jgi:hypothetical protein
MITNSTPFMEAYMKLTIAAVILFTSVATSFAGSNFTPFQRIKSHNLVLLPVRFSFSSAFQLRECLCVHQPQQIARQP